MTVLKILSLALTSILLSLPVSAKNWSKVKCPGDAQLAKDLLRAELAGWRLPEIKGQCIQQKTFKYFRVTKSDASEDLRPNYYVREKKSYKIRKIEKLAAGKRRVHFTAYTRKGKAVKDSFVYARLKGVPKEAIGCAGLLVEPKKYYVKRSCYK